MRAWMKVRIPISMHVEGHTRRLFSLYLWIIFYTCALQCSSIHRHALAPSRLTLCEASPVRILMIICRELYCLFRMIILSYLCIPAKDPAVLPHAHAHAALVSPAATPLSCVQWMSWRRSSLMTRRGRIRRKRRRAISGRRPPRM